MAKINGIVFDIKLMRPGCVLLQAALTNDSSVAHRFPTHTWLTSLTPDMRTYGATEEQIDKLVHTE
jgi:hypothetical protein